MTALAIALGVAFMSGSLVFSSTLASSLYVAVLRGYREHEGGRTSSFSHSPRPPMPRSARPHGPFLHRCWPRWAHRARRGRGGRTGLPRHRRPARQGRQSAEKAVRRGAQLARRSSVPVRVHWLARDHPPASPSAGRIDQGVGIGRGINRVGDQVWVFSIAGRAMTFTVSGITGYGSGSSIAGGSMAIFTVDEVQRLFGKTGGV